jgi:signal transduction histidine kinase
VTVTVTNDGVLGERAAPRAAGCDGSFGVVGLRERAEALGGGVEAGPTPDGGWRLLVFLPADGG